MKIKTTQFGPEYKIWIPSFSYAKAIIKDDVTYPIVPNCPIINVDNPSTIDVSNIPVGTFFIKHSQDGDDRGEFLCLRVPDDTTGADTSQTGNGFVVLFSRQHSEE